jgi:FtsZ-interacting cell division protein ZipA
MKDATPAGLSLALDVARAPDTRRSFESMARLAHQLAAVLGGGIVDDNGQALDERAVAAIAQQLDTVRARLESQGIAPGSPTALRLFS